MIYHIFIQIKLRRGLLCNR